MRITRLRSGGQTGADQGGLCAGLVLGIPTSGWAPRDYRTDDGPEPALAAFGRVPTADPGYTDRTRHNVRDSDGTVFFGRLSPGFACTSAACDALGRPLLHLLWERDWPLSADNAREFQAWLATRKIRALNIAGNRERINPGIGHAVGVFLIGALPCG